MQVIGFSDRNNIHQSVAGVDNFPEDEFSAASAKLSEGIKICRSVVEGYRGLLSTSASSELTEPANDLSPEHAQGDGSGA